MDSLKNLISSSARNCKADGRNAFPAVHIDRRLVVAYYGVRHHKMFARYSDNISFGEEIGHEFQRAEFVVILPIFGVYACVIGVLFAVADAGNVNQIGVDFIPFGRNLAMASKHDAVLLPKEVRLIPDETRHEREQGEAGIPRKYKDEGILDIKVRLVRSELCGENIVYLRIDHKNFASGCQQNG